MIPFKNSEFDSLFHKVATHNCSLDYLEEVQTFHHKFIGKEEYGQIKSKCKQLMSMMYTVNNLPDKSLDIDLNLLQNHSASDPIFFIAIVSAIKTSAELQRTDELVHHVGHFLKEPHIEWLSTLPVLAWYVKFYPNNVEGSATDFEEILNNITSNLNIRVDSSLSFITRVEFVHGEFVRGARDLRIFTMTYLTALPDQKDRLINDYLQRETINFFKTQVMGWKQK